VVSQHGLSTKPNIRVHHVPGRFEKIRTRQCVGTSIGGLNRRKLKHRLVQLALNASMQVQSREERGNRVAIETLASAATRSGVRGSYDPELKLVSAHDAHRILPSPRARVHQLE
jgi:hypothetical protein